MDASEPDYSETRFLPLPQPDRDAQFFWEGCREGKLLIQTCVPCRRLRHPPSPSCPWCHSFEWTTTESCGRGAVYSVTIHHHPPLSGVRPPHLVVLIELEEGTRLVSNIPDAAPESVRIGDPVEVYFAPHPADEQVVLPLFRPKPDSTATA